MVRFGGEQLVATSCKTVQLHVHSCPATLPVSSRSSTGLTTAALSALDTLSGPPKKSSTEVQVMMKWSEYNWSKIPKRWQLIILLHTGFIIEYCLRVNASVAVVDMKRQFDWDDYDRGLMLSSFYWGYAFGQLPSNYIVQKTGAAKMTFACSILIASVLTILLPIAAHVSFRACLVVRACIGLAESAAFPAAYNMYPLWIPASEQTVMITCIMSGLYLGEIFCFLFSGYLVVSSFVIWDVEIGGWVSVYWVFGVIGLLWVPIWIMCIYETPKEHPTISMEELALLTDNLHKHELLDTDDGILDNIENPTSDIEVILSPPKSDIGIRTVPAVELTSLRRVVSAGSIAKKESDHLNPVDREDKEVSNEGEAGTPWAAFLVHPASVTLVFCFWTQNWIGYLILSELPTYFTEQLGFGLKSAGILSMAPYIAQFLSTLLFGFTFQWLQQHWGWTTRSVRQWAQHTCFIGASACLLFCGFVNDSAYATCLMISALAFYGACQSGIACAFLDVSPRYSSTLNTFANVFASLAGVVTPLVVSLFTGKFSGVWGWRYVFIVTAAQCAFASTLWYYYQTSSVVKLLNTPVPSTKSFWDSLFNNDSDLWSLWFSCEVKQL